MAYAAGDTVVHPRHGVAVVRNVVTRGEGAKAAQYLELFFDLKALTIMVPVDSLEEVGIRPPATRAEAEEVLATLTEDADVPEVWAERNAATASRVGSTELLQAAMVIRDLTRHSERTGKPLSASENGVLQACLNSVALELSLSLGLSQDDTRALILDKVGAGADL